jgi:16S rRNA (uracil1498-N3)-methyltransferase
MANQYFIFRELLPLQTVFSIADEAAAHHIFNVMRAQAGDKLRLVFNGGEIACAEVVSADECTLKLLELLPSQTELPIGVTIAVGFPKGDKLAFITEKATELGAVQIWAAPFKWSVAKWDKSKQSKKQEKLEKIALGAAEQSRRQIRPTVELFETLSALTERFADFDQVLVAYEEAAKQGETTAFVQSLSALSVQQKVLLIFGAEGGIAPEEVQLFEQKGAQCIGLGPRILRAETAPLYALSVISTYFELLGHTD